ncbi:MAG: SDR family oxidoreductase [SAR202 cluster bacterium]|jgi:3-oxoacyl-[acyl-carrier protein] reductase|nr:SDR family oxidoreductase [SAR202 cluster bacterium]
MKNKPLIGKVAIVTGAGSPTGLGRAMTLALVRAGARVAMLDINETWLEQSAKDIRKAGGDDCVLLQQCDVSDPESAQEAVSRTIAGLGGLHILINNAGILKTSERQTYTRTNFWDITPETWSNTMAVNGNGPFHMAKASVSHMLSQKWGRVIGVTTSVDTMYREGMSAYGPSKACHEAFVALMSRELENTGVTANVLIPGGTVDTNMIPSGIEHEKTTLMQPEVMQAPAVWLASEESKSTNGQRFIAYNWDESLPIKQRLEKAGAPAAWPQLGNQSINPWS